MNFKLQKITVENEATFELSKICGSPVFPLGFLEKHGVYDDLFVAQLNLSELKIPELPQTGMLYFFLNVEYYPYQARVLYTNDQVAEVFELINEYFEDFGDPTGYQIVPTPQDNGLGICTEFNPDLDLDSVIETTNNLNLLEIDTLMLPCGSLELGQPDGWYLFVISKEDLQKGDFSKVQFLAYGS